MKDKKETYSLGTVLFGPKIYVTDPCYKVGTWCQHVISYMLPGEYHAEVVLSDEGKVGGIRVKSLMVRHINYPDAETDELISGEIGIDSGQCGFFDGAYFERQDRNEQEHEEFYDLACARTSSVRSQGGVMGNYGIVSRSGYGDGGYNLYVARNDDGKVIAAEVVFI